MTHDFEFVVRGKDQMILYPNDLDQPNIIRAGQCFLYFLSEIPDFRKRNILWEHISTD